MIAVTTGLEKNRPKLSTLQNIFVWVGGAGLFVTLMVILSPAIQKILASFISSKC